MKEPLDPVRRAEHSITKTYRASLWTPFIAAVKRYELISPGTASRFAYPAERTPCCWRR